MRGPEERHHPRRASSIQAQLAQLRRLRRPQVGGRRPERGSDRTAGLAPEDVRGLKIARARPAGHVHSLGADRRDELAARRSAGDLVTLRQTRAARPPADGAGGAGAAAVRPPSSPAPPPVVAPASVIDIYNEAETTTPRALPSRDLGLGRPRLDKKATSPITLITGWARATSRSGSTIWLWASSTRSSGTTPEQQAPRRLLEEGDDPRGDGRRSEANVMYSW
jgi:hypothetical protein